MKPWVFIYLLVDPRTFEIRYVGKTHNLRERLYVHMSNARRGNKAYVYNWIRLLTREDLSPMMFVVEVIWGDWRQAEKRWIKSLREQGCRLTNQTDGGEGAFGRAHSIETKRKIGEKSKGRVRSSEALKKCSESCKRALQNNPKVKANAKRLVHLFGKPVICLDTGKIFPSAGEAARALNLNNAKIGQVCLGRRKSTGGLKFAFYNKEN